MRAWGAKIVTVWVVCSLIIAGGLILTLSGPTADGPERESIVINLGEEFLKKVIAMGPSPFLLFAMGGLGIGCVLVNERQRQRYRHRPDSDSGNRKASEPRIPQSIYPA